MGTAEKSEHLLHLCENYLNQIRVPSQCANSGISHYQNPMGNIPMYFLPRKKTIVLCYLLKHIVLPLSKIINFAFCLLKRHNRNYIWKYFRNTLFKYKFWGLATKFYQNSFSGQGHLDFYSFKIFFL